MRARAGLVFLAAAVLAGCGGGSGTGSGTAGHGGGAGGRGGAAGGTAGRDGSSGAGGTTGTGGLAGAGGSAAGAGAGGAGGLAGNAGGMGGTSGAAGTTGAGGTSGGGGSSGASGRGGGSAGTGGAAGTGVAGTGGAAGTAGTGGIAGAAGAGGVAGAAGTGGGAGAVADGGSTDGMCVPNEQAVLGYRPDILVLLDASGSMNDDELGQLCTGGCGANSKWALTTAAVNQVVGMTDGTVNWGLKFFAESGSCGVNSSAAVLVGPANAAAIATAIAGRTSANGGVSNGSSTPTRLAENGALTYLSAVVDTNPKFILLATDGLPNCPALGNQQNDDSPGAIQAVSNAYGAGVATFVVGVGIAGLSTADTVLSSMAMAGGRPRAATPTYYPVGGTSELVATLNQLVGIARSCRFPLAAPPGFSGDAIDVRGDGASIPRDPNHANGWDYTDATHTAVDLFGPACTGVTGGSTARVSIVYDCPPAG